jgi:hypothetical protein
MFTICLSGDTGHDMFHDMFVHGLRDPRPCLSLHAFQSAKLAGRISYIVATATGEASPTLGEEAALV